MPTCSRKRLHDMSGLPSASDAQRLDETELEKYWRTVSQERNRLNDDGLSLVCYAGMPAWFNNLIHRYQVRTVERLLTGRTIRGARVLDIGTGVGRWARWYAARGAAVTGIDLEPHRLRIAAAHDDGINYERMPADELRFRDDSFDIINCVTVLQHTSDDVKHRAISEIARVAAPGAAVVMLELTDMSDDASHVFPWTRSAWAAALADNGFTATKEAGTEYIPLLRVLKRLHRATEGDASRSRIEAVKGGRRNLRDRAELLVLRAAVAASYPIEEVATRVARPDHARIGAWLFEQTAQSQRLAERRAA
jgi:ubiquinone/menaquinone biosynthesis C-methylase UbiE